MVELTSARMVMKAAIVALVASFFKQPFSNGDMWIPPPQLNQRGRKRAGGALSLVILVGCPALLGFRTAQPKLQTGGRGSKLGKDIEFSQEYGHRNRQRQVSLDNGPNCLALPNFNTRQERRRAARDVLGCGRPGMWRNLDQYYWPPNNHG